MNSGIAVTNWNMMTEAGATIVAALSKADDATKQKIKTEVFELINQRCPADKVAIDTSAIVISAEK